MGSFNRQVFSGADGHLYATENNTVASSNKVAKVKNWTMTANQAIIETVSLAEYDRTIIPGTRSLTGSCSLYYHNDSRQDVFFKSIFKAVGTTGAPSDEASPKVSMRLSLGGGDFDAHDRFMEFRCLLTSLTVASTVGEVSSMDCTFEVDGTLTSWSLFEGSSTD